MIPSGARVIRETFDVKRRALVVGTFFAGNKVGLTLGIPLSAVLLHNWGWSAVFYITGGLGLVWLVWWLAVYRAPPREAEKPPRPPPMRSAGGICCATARPGA